MSRNPEGAGVIDTSQICRSGHLITTMLHRYPEKGSAFCRQCGAPTISACEDCGSPIPGFDHGSPVVVVTIGDDDPPDPFCQQCGAPFPWAPSSKTFPALAGRLSHEIAEATLPTEFEAAKEWRGLFESWTARVRLLVGRFFPGQLEEFDRLAKLPSWSVELRYNANARPRDHENERIARHARDKVTAFLSGLVQLDVSRLLSSPGPESMTMTAPSRSRLEEFRASLQAISDPLEWDQVQAWAIRVRPYFKTHFKDYVDDLDRLTKMPGWALMPVFGETTEEDRAEDRRLNAGIAERAHSQVVALFDGLIELLPADDLPRSAQEDSMSNKAFVVHGRDDHAKTDVARTLERLGLEAVILHEQPNRGRTIIEKFEGHDNVAFAVVILTPDDVGGLAGGGDQKARARQNVVFEFGYFVGKLGRGRVCALYKGDVELPSDIHGIVYVRMDEDGAWRHKLCKELREAGIDVDANRL